MKICIDARMYRESGIGRYIRNLLSSLQIIDQENHYIILLTKENFQDFVLGKNFEKVLADFRWYGVAEQIKLLGLLKLFKPDLVHFPHFNAPLFYNGKFVVTVHDLIHQHYQMRRSTTHDPITYKIKQIGYRAVFKNAVQKACKILVPSNSVKDLLVKEWNIAGEKTVVTYEAVDDKIIKLSQACLPARQESRFKSQKVLEKFNIKPPYIFYVGNAHPHKNIEGLIKVYFKLKMDSRLPAGRHGLRGNDSNRLKLVLSGHDHYFWQRIKKENQVNGIIFTGEVTDEELVVLYKNAECFVMPSFEEGFGIPVLEAMASGCPVVCSDIRVFREIGGAQF